MSDFRVQRGTTIIPAGPATDVLLDPTTVEANTWVRPTNVRFVHSGPDDPAPEDLELSCKAIWRQTGAPAIRILTKNSTPVEVTWEVVEYVGAPGGPNEFSVVHGQIVSLPGGAGTGFYVLGAGSAAAVNSTLFMLNGLDRPNTPSSQNWDSAQIAVQPLVFLSFLLVFSFRVATVNTATVSFEIISFTGSNWRLGFTIVSPTAGGVLTDSPALTAPDLSTPFTVNDWDNAFLVHSGMANNGNTDQDVGCVVIPGNDQTTVRAQVAPGATIGGGQPTINVWVVENPDLQVIRENSIEGSGVPLPGTELARADSLGFCFDEASSWVTATAYHEAGSTIGAGFWNYALADNKTLRWARAVLNDESALSQWAREIISDAPIVEIGTTWTELSSNPVTAWAGGPNPITVWDTAADPSSAWTPESADPATGWTEEVCPTATWTKQDKDDC